jgi:hypothetical protein
VKKVFIYITLFFYITVQLKPLVVILEDVIAHTFYKVQHMATVHFENGAYHLHAELNTIAEEDNKKSQQNAPSSVKADESISVHVKEEFIVKPADHQLISAIVFSQKQDVISPFIKKSSPPPKA